MPKVVKGSLWLKEAFSLTNLCRIVSEKRQCIFLFTYIYTIGHLHHVRMWFTCHCIFFVTGTDGCAKNVTEQYDKPPVTADSHSPVLTTHVLLFLGSSDSVVCNRIWTLLMILHIQHTDLQTSCGICNIFKASVWFLWQINDEITSIHEISQLSVNLLK